MMYEDDYTINSNCVVGAIINKRLAKDGYEWQTSPTSSCANNKVIKSAWALCEEFESRYKKQFSEMCSSVNGHGVSGEFYLSVLNQLVSDDMHLGRVVGILTFAGAMSVHCMRTNHSERIDLVREWTSQFIQKNVESWLQKNGGWKALVEFYESGTKKEEEKSGWGKYLLGGALGVFAMGALIVNRA